MRVSIWSVIAFLATTSVGSADEPKPVSFKSEIAPILVRKCLACHNDAKSESGLNMKTFALMKRGGKTLGEDILTPGDPDSSYLVELVRPDGEPRMPYKLTPLRPDELRLVERWVDEGAKFDGPSETETPIASLVDPLRGLPEVALKAPVADPVSALVFAPDGQRIAAGQGKSVHVFDVTTRKRTLTLPDHPGPVTAVRFTPDGKHVIAVGGRPGQFGSVVVWDLEARKRRHDLRGHQDAILAAALAPNGKRLATAGYDRLILIWDLETGRIERELKEHTDSVHGVAFAPDEATLASASADRTIKVWDVATGKRLASLSDATAEQYAVRYAPDGKTIFGAGVDRTIRAWSLEGGSAPLARSVIAHDGPVLRLIVAPDGKSLYSASEDRSIKVWDLATLAPRAALPPQPDWPLDLAVSPDGTLLAVGRYDGSLALLGPKQGDLIAGLLEAPKAPEPPQPELVRNASLGPPNPRGAARGTSVRLTLTGNGVDQADRVRFSEPGIEAAIVKPEKPTPNRLQLDLQIAPDARVGAHRFVVRTPLGVPAAQSFSVSEGPEHALVEPDDSPGEAKLVPLPATLLGTIDKPGDIDHVRFEARAGRTYVFEALARGLGSGLNGGLTLLGPDGRVIAEAQDTPNSLDPLLIAAVPTDGTYALRVTDAEYGGSGTHFYRIRSGTAPLVQRVFPLGVERGATTTVRVEGPNLGGTGSVSVAVPADAEPGSTRSVVVKLADGTQPLSTRPVVVAAGTQSIEAENNDTPQSANGTASPGGASGRIDRPGDVDHFRFEAKQRRPVIVEVFARRLGTAMDPRIEVLDAEGRSVPRVVLRPVAETNVAFRDHGSRQRTIRLTVWNDLAMRDYVLIGREVLRITELPRNPDDDAVFWGLGIARSSLGERMAAFETTPEQHAMGQSILKVEPYPPGTTLPAGGAAPVTLTYRNDDGGPGFQGDARVTFDPPKDGTYIVRVENASGLGGPDHGYHLVVREPRPDFRLSLNTENPNVPRGGTALVTASVERIDGFNAPIDVALEGLPEGITATTARIEPDFHAGEIVLMAAPTAASGESTTWSAVARARTESGEVITHAINPGQAGGFLTVTPPPNLKVVPQTDRVTIRPGERVSFNLAVDRGPAFKGRVPIDVRNLPYGVRVLNIGLNGVLITERETERTVFLYAEPWVAAQERPFFAVGKCEAAGTEHSSAPVSLIVEPRPAVVATASGDTPPPKELP